MTTPTQAALFTALNEFFREYEDRHGRNQATRDEATNLACQYELIVSDALTVAQKYAALADVHDRALEIAMTLIDEPADLVGPLVGRMVDVQMEGV